MPSVTRSWWRSVARSSIFSAGCCFINAGSREMISLSMKLNGVPTRSEPRNSPVPRASWSASSSAARIASTRIRYVAPASVSVTARVVRLKSVAPTSSSSAAISRDVEGCDRPSSRPALEKLPTRAARANSLSAESRSFIARCARGGLHGGRSQREGCQDRIERGGDRHHSARLKRKTSTRARRLPAKETASGAGETIRMKLWLAEQRMPCPYPNFERRDLRQIPVRDAPNVR
ncbi:hypothetical protein SAMN05519103_08878 [Rhizobiales bacterium GAS113]|nr:hypothetical protein SAMN05519103_08878 [Rhizobiales bacterium GAS113]